MPGAAKRKKFFAGFNCDHGTDIWVNIDGLPVNMVSQPTGNVIQTHISLFRRPSAILIMERVPIIRSTVISTPHLAALYLHLDQEFVYAGDEGMTWGSINLNIAIPRAIGAPKGEKYILLGLIFTSQGGIFISRKRPSTAAFRIDTRGTDPQMKRAQSRQPDIFYGTVPSTIADRNLKSVYLLKTF